MSPAFILFLPHTPAPLFLAACRSEALLHGRSASLATCRSEALLHGRSASASGGLFYHLS
ncbi:hypothetical protein FTUN_4953 [Frigoriglobus tundricola]|uniref:Uncharacterized protein n=1 Tax=Frigoriglobus tundricola TaxID=2774151 RepID=A0A6M5YU15_9BACT|nr:hypothetical protein FTUN_4953 [Frigoriglobus tundricola]